MANKLTKAQVQEATKDERAWILKNIPTNRLLKEFRNGRKTQYYEGTEEWDDAMWNRPVYLTMEKFSTWNPHPGKASSYWYTTKEVKAELDKRENIEK